MIRRLLLAALVLAALTSMLGLLLAAQTVSVEAWHDSALPQGAFSVVTPRTAPDVAPSQSGAPHDLTVTSPSGSPRVGRGLASLPGPDALRRPIPSPRAVPRLAAVRPVAAVDRTVTGSGSESMTGTASWFDYVPGGAAAGPALRSALGSGWRGQVVRVCAGFSGRACVTTVLNDYCQCYGTRLIDLDAADFQRLAPLSQGLTEVTISW